ncbi:ABC transporter permease [Tsuneonella flava]|uniref:ABC transporter permease n=1 Tax=Tsuneonella flava TaxID=2055955 RepID=A0ABX7K8C5_9SPHN|nr:ABC transporter permease [Tsuneonella flava]QSB44513.1 ABC transporter permease [Tsuneonella flava]
MNIGEAFLATWRAIFRSRELLATTLLAVLLYSFYYPAPYAQQTSQELPLVVVDQDDSALSRAMVRELNATRAIRVVSVEANMLAARTTMNAGEADGVILISDGLERQLRTGSPGSGVGIWVNATYLVRASAIRDAVTAVIQNLIEEHLPPVGQVTRVGPPIAIVSEPLFNRTGGYKNYVFPAVAVVIIQQTLLLGAASYMAGRRRERNWRMGLREYLGVLTAFSSAGALTCLFLFGLMFWVQGVPVGGNIGGMIAITPLFVVCVAALGLGVGSFFDRFERAMAILAPASVPFFFLTGAAWPLDQMPRFVAAIAWLIPSTAGLHTFVPLNQMGASLYEVRGAAGILLALAAVFVILAGKRIVSRTPASG